MLRPKVYSIHETTGYQVELAPDTARRLYWDIDAMLSAADVHSPDSRGKVDAPILYALYDELYAAGMADEHPAAERREMGKP